ncbi:hypothetical protein HEP83_17245 [Streptomyces sp. RLA2-12]|nr:hypothetical protein [Streptomyces sp. RLA2-12]
MVEVDVHAEGEGVGVEGPGGPTLRLARLGRGHVARAQVGEVPVRRRARREFGGRRGPYDLEQLGRGDRHDHREAGDLRHARPGQAHPGQQDHRQAEDQDAQQALQIGESGGAALGAQHREVRLHDDPQQRADREPAQQRGRRVRVTVAEDVQDERRTDEQQSAHRQHDPGHPPDRGPGVRGEPRGIVRTLDGQRGAHVDGEQVDRAADRRGDVEVRVVGGTDLRGDDHRDEIDHGEREERAGVVAGEEASDLLERGRVRALLGRLDVPGDQPPEDQQAERYHRQGDRGDPGDEDARRRDRGGESDQQCQLHRGEHGVAHRHPERAAQSGQHAVLQGQQRPGDDRQDEAEAVERAVQEAVRGSPCVQRQQEDHGGQRHDHRTSRVRTEDEASGGAARDGDEAGQGAGQGHRGQAREELHRGDRGGALADRGVGVVAGGDQPVAEPEHRGDPGVEHQGVGVAEELVASAAVLAAPAGQAEAAPGPLLGRLGGGR